MEKAKKLIKYYRNLRRYADYIFKRLLDRLLKNEVPILSILDRNLENGLRGPVDNPMPRQNPDPRDPGWVKFKNRR